MEETCCGCLSKDRKLRLLSDIKYSHIFTEILNEIYVSPYSPLCVRLCWECGAALRRVYRFKQQVHASYNVLVQNIPHPPLTSLSSHSAHSLSYPDVLVKEEGVPWDVKSEGDSTHCEPEAFVNELEVDEYLPEIETKKVKVKNKIKIKVDKKRKSKSVCDKVSKKVKNISIENGTDQHESVHNNIIEEPPPLPPLPPPSKRPRSKEVLPDRPQCADCGKQFSSKKTYRYHMNVIHKGQNKHPCPRCGKTYQWKSNLGRHMRTHKAADNGELYCEKCDKSFASVATYRQHLKITKTHVPESEFSFVCTECGQKFATPTRLRDHVDWDHLKKIKFKCDLCNKSFKSYTSLYVHTQHFHKNKAKKDNLCHVCGKSYQNAAKLKYHITAMHSGETPHRCAHCGAAFGWYTSLYRHVREVHYKIKLYPKKVKKGTKKDQPDIPYTPTFGALSTDH